MKTRDWAALTLAAGALGVGACSSSSEETNGPVYDGGLAFDDAGDAMIGDAAGGFDVFGQDAPAARDAAGDSSIDSASDAPHDARDDVANDALAATDGNDDGSAASDAAACTSTVAVVGGNATSAFAATWSSGAWVTPTSLAGATLLAPPAMTTYGSGYLAVLNETSKAVVSTVFASGAWSTVAGVSGVMAQGAPSVARLGSSAHLVYWGLNGKFYHGTYAAGAWDSAADPVGGTTVSFGSSAPTVASAAGDLALTQAGTNDSLYDQLWTGSWQMGLPLAGATVEPTVTPRIVALTGGGADLMIVAARQTDDVLLFDVRTTTTQMWTGLSPVSGATTYTASTVSVAPLSNGGAMLVYLGGDSHAYYSVYDPTPTPAWSAVLPLLTGSPLVASPPSVTAGVCGDDVIAAIALSTGGVETTSYRNGAWQAPVAITGTTGATYASIATSP